MGEHEHHHTSADAASAAAVLDPIRDLDSLSPLLLDPEARTAAFAAFPNDRRLVIEQVFRHIDYLKKETRWDTEKLLRRLGCQLRLMSDFRDVGVERLESCETFLGLLVGLIGLVGTEQQQREVVDTCVDLLQERTARSAAHLRELLVRTAADWSPLDYLSLGEVSRAARLVRTLAGQPEGSEHAQNSYPFVAASLVHLSTPRIDSFIRGEVAAFGERVYDHIEVHLDDCAACRGAVEARRRELAAQAE